MKIAIRIACLSLLLALSAGCERQSAPEPSTESTLEAPSQIGEGDTVPDLELVTQSGATVALRSLRGKRILLYFYPEDRTRGCTLQARGIRDAYASFERANLTVLGVSTQDAESHREFIEQEQLPFDLVVDADGALARTFGVDVTAGRAARDTVLIDEHGKVQKLWRGVSPNDHAERVLAEVATW